jgi:hypothetical protein
VNFRWKRGPLLDSEYRSTHNVGWAPGAEEDGRWRWGMEEGRRSGRGGGGRLAASGSGRRRWGSRATSVRCGEDEGGTARCGVYGCGARAVRAGESYMTG